MAPVPSAGGEPVARARQADMNEISQPGMKVEVAAMLPGVGHGNDPAAVVAVTL